VNDKPRGRGPKMAEADLKLYSLLLGGVRGRERQERMVLSARKGRLARSARTSKMGWVIRRE